MKKIKMLFLTLSLVFCVIFALPFNTSAASKKTQDGLEVTITTNKVEYISDEDIQVSINIQNNNSYKVENVSIETLLPEGLLLKTGDVFATDVDIEAGDLYSISFVAQLSEELKNSEGNKPVSTTKQNGTTKSDKTTKLNTTTKFSDNDKEVSSPQTGDNSNIVLWIVLIIISVVGIILTFKFKKTKKMMSLFLCFAMILTILPVNAFATENNMSTIMVDKSITVDGKDYEFVSTITYIVTNIEDATYTVSFDLNYKDAKNNISQQTIKWGECVTYPCVPTRDHYTFAGWYLNKDETDLSNQYDFSQNVSSDIILYAKWIDIDIDSDGDKIPDDLESYFGSNSQKNDSDNDGLNDYEECIILGTDPIKSDTDNNGIIDYKEDADGDGLNNGYEFSIMTNPIAQDTDFDNITDFDEIKGITYKTSPINADTDEDGANDDWEIKNNFDPTTYNNNFEIVVESETTNISASVTTVLPGEKVESLSVTPILNHPILSDKMPGYIDVPFEFTVNENLNGASATISFTLNEENNQINDFCPTIYYYDEATQTLEELPTTVVGNVVSTTVTHFSSYILLNKTDFDKVWENEIKPPLTSENPEDEATLDIVFVIDYSFSMEENDPYQLFKDLSEDFVNKLRDGKDKAGAVKFIRRATLVSDLTTDKESVITAINGISYDDGYGTYSGTDGSTGIKMALDQMKTSDSEYQYIVFITDGEDNGYTYSYDSLIKTATESNVTIYAVGMGSADESVLEKISIQTGGKYYHATTGVSVNDLINLDDVFEDIESETVDLTTDSDGDKIPDYYELRLTNGSGVRLDLDIDNPDCDGDGLLDGEEIVITTDKYGKVYGQINSDPWFINTDLDIYNDYDELKKYGSDPLRKNVAFLESDTTFLVDNENFVSDKYMDFYENDWYGWLERASIWLGNNVFGSNYDTTYMYKVILMNYLEQMVEESEEKDQIRELVGFSHKLLSQMNTNVGVSMEIVNKADKDLLKNLRQQLNNYSKNLDEIANADLINAGYTKEQIYKLWDDSFADYRRVSEEIPELKNKIEFNTKIGKASEVVGFVFDITDVAISGYDFYKEYNTFASAISGMENCLETLEIIQNSADSPNKLKTAAKELHKVIEEQKINNLDTFFDGLNKVGGKIINVSSTFIPVVGKYIAAAKLILGIGDFMFNVSDVAEQCTCLYAISKSSSIIANSFSQDLSKGTASNNYINLYNGYVGATEKYFSLAIMRKTSEKQMKKADEANSFLIEWLFTDIMYKVETIDKNVKKIDSIKLNYVTAGVTN